MTIIARYEEISAVSTPLNPIDDLISWISGLASIGYTSDILRTIHKMAIQTQILSGARLISVHAENTIGLLDQAFSGSPDVSFLPLYYAILNLSKIYIIASGRANDLLNNRYHGASYDASKSRRGLLTDEIILRERGVLPLFYKVLTHRAWRWNNRPVRLADVYPFIPCISFEYDQAFGLQSRVQPITLRLNGNPSSGFTLIAELLALDKGLHPLTQSRRYLKIFAGLRSQSNHPARFVSDKIMVSTDTEARAQLLSHTKRHLLYHIVRDLFNKPVGIYTALSAAPIELAEEIPIWLAFFHLSNVVRYKPDTLARIKDSAAWPMLLCLQRHALLRFLVIFWSFTQQRTIELQID
ncbi:MAG TPA: hypothetical protein ENH65_06070 [Candidatus Aminicenantes bacterium]|nr:hypothetical protein [Candidatus Aminicenantes bacterium]